MFEFLGTLWGNQIYWLPYSFHELNSQLPVPGVYCLCLQIQVSNIHIGPEKLLPLSPESAKVSAGA